MATASTPYFERQWILNVSHVWMVVRMLVDQSKLFLVVREICPPRRSCRSSRSSKACAEPDQPIDRSNRSVATARNGRRAISVDGPRRILSGQSDMTGCAPASRCTMGTSYRLTGCEGPKRRQHAVLRAAPAAIFGWLVLVSVPKPCFSGAVPLVGFYLVARQRVCGVSRPACALYPFGQRTVRCHATIHKQIGAKTTHEGR